ncbi:DUF2627 domain-containing protein [Oceanobacillus halophilus]|uniref:DUF2627 domain-containing protein n=1 Tax=Oceanobacillus halophilus TaxID=930130 RepID=A0A495AD00_9BACI|nr:DUF2627 domain-containing protein [Oceanobacillus halophilus]RKQ37742.1 DUF2627 domain-containing protein [Oceanobacillus halophilus]
MKIIAFILLLIPGLVAVFGIKLMRDALFAEYYSFLINSGIQFSAGLVLFILGFAFIGGFIVYRDRKNKYQAIPDNKQKELKSKEKF